MWFSIEDRDLMERISRAWDPQRIQQLAMTWFDPETTIAVCRMDALPGGTQGISLKIDCRERRTTDSMPPSVENWFEHITRNLAPFEPEFARTLGI